MQLLQTSIEYHTQLANMSFDKSSISQLFEAVDYNLIHFLKISAGGSTDWVVDTELR